jgi:hypothetical protein
MKFKTIFIIHAIVPLAYGICFELVPQLVLSTYGVTQGPGEILMGRYFGVALIGIGLVCWLARDVTDAKARRAIILALLISNIIGVIVSVQGTLSGVMSAVGWSAVGIYVLLGLGVAYLFMRSGSPE